MTLDVFSLTILIFHLVSLVSREHVAVPRKRIRKRLQ